MKKYNYRITLFNGNYVDETEAPRETGSFSMGRDHAGLTAFLSNMNNPLLVNMLDRVKYCREILSNLENGGTAYLHWNIENSFILQLDSELSGFAQEGKIEVMG
jgi:hypothetical protein